MNINPLNIISFVKNISIQANTEEKSAPESQPQTNMSPKTYLNENFNFNKEVKFNNINLYQQLLLIKELLKLPKEWMDLMNWSFPEAKDAKTLSKLISQGAEVDIKSLISLLQTNSKEALSKLLKLTSPSPENFQNLSQLKELVSLLKKITPENNIPLNQFLNNIIPLYIPFTAPLQSPQILSEFEEEIPAEKSKDLALLAYMTTEQLGRFKIYVYKKAGGLECVIENDFKEKETQNHVEILLEKVKNVAHLQKIETNFNELQIKRNDKREIHIKQILSPACDVLTATFTVIKALFALDEKISLLENRKTKI
ncbi:MAG: hypothetical protein WCK67_06700 [bacterium]